MYAWIKRKVQANLEVDLWHVKCTMVPVGAIWSRWTLMDRWTLDNATDQYDGALDWFLQIFSLQHRAPHLQ